MFTLALLTGRLWSYWRFHQVVNTHTHTQSCKFFGYQQVEYWHPLWWLHTISTDHKANRRRTRVGVTGLSFTRWKTQPWLHVSVYSCRVAMTTCHAGCSAMPWHFHTSGKHTYTHFHSTDECLEVGSSCDRSWNIPFLSPKPSVGWGEVGEGGKRHKRIPTEVLLYVKIMRNLHFFS